MYAASSFFTGGHTDDTIGILDNIAYSFETICLISAY